MENNSKLPVLRFIFWEATIGCNLECIHCRRLEVSQRLALNDLSTLQAMLFIKSISEDFDPKPVLVFSGGEPLMRPDIFKLAEYAFTCGVPTALATNGTLINENLAKEIAESKVRRVSISLDGATADVHDRFRKIPGSFERATNGFRLLRKNGVALQLNATIARHNVDQIEDIYRLALELGAEALHYFLLVPVGCGLEIKEEYQLTPEEYEDSLLWIYELANERKIYIRPICAPHYFRILAQKRSDLPRSRGEQHSLNQMTRGCLAGTGICFVSHKGDVFPCGYMPLSCGNVRQESLHKIWKDSHFFYLLRHTSYLEGKCGVCEFRNICSGCRARAYEETGNFLDEEPNCSYRPSKFKSCQLD